MVAVRLWCVQQFASKYPPGTRTLAEWLVSTSRSDGGGGRQFRTSAFVCFADFRRMPRLPACRALNSRHDAKLENVYCGCTACLGRENDEISPNGRDAQHARLNFRPQCHGVC